MKQTDLPVPDYARSFFDPDKLRHQVLTNAKDAYQKALNKIETDRFKLHVADLQIEHDKHFPVHEQKQALLERRDLVVPLKGLVQLVDKHSGKVVDEKKTVVANIPYVTNRNTTILNGSEYITVTQQRLKPGIYTRIKETGETEAHVNVLPGTGMGGRIIFLPEKAIFVYMVSTTQIKLYGLLKGLGISDAQMEQAWGREIFEKNKAAYKGDEIAKFYSKVFERS